MEKCETLVFYFLFLTLCDSNADLLLLHICCACMAACNWCIILFLIVSEGLHHFLHLFKFGFCIQEFDFTANKMEISKIWALLYLLHTNNGQIHLNHSSDIKNDIELMGTP